MLSLELVVQTLIRSSARGSCTGVVYDGLLLVVQICDYLAHLKQGALMGNYISVIILTPLRVDLKNENSLFNLVGRSARQMFIEDI